MAIVSSVKINWIEGLLIKTFGLNKIIEGFEPLANWLIVENNLLPADIAQLEILRLKLKKRYSGWNEETLKMKFIALILNMVEYDTDDFEGVFDAELKGTVQAHKLSVVADYALAKVTFDLIEQPYFYFHEYKARKKSKDPVAQILLAMLIAQEKNERKHPLYRCAVIGENWYFMVMDGKEYSVSSPYVSLTTDGLQNILLILRKFKNEILIKLAY